jgi:hypothetical protein
MYLYEALRFKLQASPTSDETRAYRLNGMTYVGFPIADLFGAVGQSRISWTT